MITRGGQSRDAGAWQRSVGAERGSGAWELSVGAEQGRRARGLVIYRLAALLWCSDAVGRLHVNEAACQERCRRTALRRACDNTWRLEQRCGRLAAQRGS